MSIQCGVKEIMQDIRIKKIHAYGNRAQIGRQWPSLCQFCVDLLVYLLFHVAGPQQSAVQGFYVHGLVYKIQQYNECLHLSVKSSGLFRYFVFVGLNQVLKLESCWFAVDFLALFCHAAGMRQSQEAFFVPQSTPLLSAIIYSHHPLQFGSLPTPEGSVGRAVIPLLPHICGRWESHKEKGGEDVVFPCLRDFQGYLRSTNVFWFDGAVRDARGRVTPSVHCGKLFCLRSYGSQWVELEKPH